jgi:preprotein translocase subunit YajC
MLGALEKNDDIVTSGGIHGTIVNIQDDVVTLRIDDNTRIKIQKSSISRLKRPKTESK